MSNHRKWSICAQFSVHHDDEDAALEEASNLLAEVCRALEAKGCIIRWSELEEV